VRAAPEYGQAVSRLLRAAGEDRRSADDVRAAHRAHSIRHTEAQRAWEAQAVVIPAPRVYDKEIAPHLSLIPSSAIRAATGLSAVSVKALRAGRQRAHPRDWEALKAVIARLGDGERETWRELDDALFDREIGPRLGAVPAEALQQATGLSASYCRRMRAGHHVPHKRHWTSLRALVRRVNIVRTP
jgi:hypothetical protein